VTWVLPAISLGLATLLASEGLRAVPVLLAVAAALHVLRNVLIVQSYRRTKSAA
jgi:hypothetical protein